MDKHNEQFDLARKYVDENRKVLLETPSMKECYSKFKEWHATQPTVQFGPLNEYQFRTLLRKPMRPRKKKKTAPEGPATAQPLERDKSTIWGVRACYFC